MVMKKGSAATASQDRPGKGMMMMMMDAVPVHNCWIGYKWGDDFQVILGRTVQYSTVQYSTALSSNSLQYLGDWNTV